MTLGVIVLLTAAALLTPAGAGAGVSMILKFDQFDAAGPNEGNWSNTIQVSMQSMQPDSAQKGSSGQQGGAQ